MRTPISSQVISYLGDPILRRIANPIRTFHQDEVHATAQQLKKLVLEHQGLGLAAPQMHSSLRMFTMADLDSIQVDDEDDDKDIELSYKIILNPIIQSRSKEEDLDVEGCLSIPGFRGLVPRHQSIQVRYQTVRGDYVLENLEGWSARIFQHELDHLDGVLFIDRAIPHTIKHSSFFKSMSDEGFIEYIIKHQNSI